MLFCGIFELEKINKENTTEPRERIVECVKSTSNGLGGEC